MSPLTTEPLPTGTPGTLATHTLWADEADTRAWAHRLAGCAQVTDAVVTLHGDLGAGKTTLVRHLLQALGVTGRIKSPTYAVVEPHQALGPAGTWPVWHFDFYRFDDPREWEDAGFRDLFAGPGLKLVEWPDRAGALLPLADLAIHIEPVDESARRVRAVAQTRRGVAWLGALAAQPMPALAEAPAL